MSRRTARTHHRDRRRFAVGLVVPFAILASFYLGTRGDEGTTVNTPKQQVGIGGIGPVLAGGRPVSLSRAETLTDLDVLLPETTLASDQTIADTWVRTENGEYIVVRYAAGIDVEIRLWEGPGTPEEHWKDLMAEGIVGEIVDIEGIPAFAVSPSAEGDKGSVSFVFGKTFVSVIGSAEQTVEDLKDLARSAITPAL